MQKTVIQIAIGEIPEARIKDMESVKEWCKIHSYNYQVISEIDNWGVSEGLSPRKWSDFKRIQILSENLYTCYIDWDVEILDFSFELKDEPVLSNYMEQFLYNADNAEIFKTLLTEMERRKDLAGEWYKLQDTIIYPSFRNVKFNPEWIIKDQDKKFIHKWATIKGG